MPGIPKRREPHNGSRYLSQIVGQRVRDVRLHREVSQDELADRMVDLGHATWYGPTVGQVEKAKRNLTVDELISLAAAFETTLAYLMSPASAWDPNYMGPVDVGRSEPVEGKDLRALYGFTWLPYPQANPNELWPSQMFEDDFPAVMAELTAAREAMFKEDDDE